MLTCLLKRVLPFTLTFMLGAVIGGLFKIHRAGPAVWALPDNATPLLGHDGPFGDALREGRSCRMYRNLVAETKPLVILFKPDARWPRELRGVGKKDIGSLWVHVTFGADGKVQNVGLTGDSMSRLGMDGPVGANEETELFLILWAVERAARQIQFEPETVNSVPITVTKDIEIHFMAD